MSKKQSAATKQKNAERAKERAVAFRKEQERKERRRRALATSAVVIGVLSLIVVIAVAIQSARDTTGQAATPPAAAVDTYGIPLGESAPVTIEVYEDFMCPFCGELEALAHDQFRGYAESGEAQVVFRPIAFLDSYSEGTEYSTRAMNAVGVVLDQEGPEAAVEMHDLLFENQPAEGTEGLTDDELVKLAVESGADEASVRGPIESLAFEQWVKNATDEASKNGVSGTPTVMVNGETYEADSFEQLLADIDQAVQAGG